MWYSLKQIIQPDSWAEAWEAGAGTKKAFLSGGSYLVAEKNSEIDTLIDLNGLLSNRVSDENDEVRIGAVATLQTVMDTLAKIRPDCRLIAASRDSCPSKNIRNQRTFGGEVSQNRPNSEVMVFLHTVDAKLILTMDSETIISIRDWDGKGIITEIRFSSPQIDAINLQRYALIPSAAAIVIVGAIRRNGRLEFALGGSANTIQDFSLPMDLWSKEKAESIAGTAVKQFWGDHLGSVEYKQSLITTALQRAGDSV